MKYTIVIISVLLSLLSTLEAQAQSWQEVREIIGSEGHVDSGVLGFSFPRSDVALTVRGTPVSSELAKAWIAFWPLPDGKTRLMGDIAMPADKVPAAQNELLNQGLEISALHNHMQGESPRMMFMHISGLGSDAESLATKVRAVLKAAEVPIGTRDEEEEEMAESEVDWSAVTQVLGSPAEQEGHIVEYTFARAGLLTINGVKLPYTEALETKPEVAFQMLDNGEVATVGELFLRASEVNNVARVLHKNGITNYRSA